MKKKKNKKDVKVSKAPFVVIIFFLLMLITGVGTGEPRAVLEQAVKVCLSCIGIG